MSETRRVEGIRRARGCRQAVPTGPTTRMCTVQESRPARSSEYACVHTSVDSVPYLCTSEILATTLSMLLLLQALHAPGSESAAVHTPAQIPPSTRAVFGLDAHALCSHNARAVLLLRRAQCAVLGTSRRCSFWVFRSVFLHTRLYHLLRLSLNISPASAHILHFELDVGTAHARSLSLIMGCDKCYSESPGFDSPRLN
ncbi:hypothetical protein C8R43DRAFT_1005312 [Mycena crocata]|nr:hypothetical protein C8R43DRAFT_1005312 [Mycena crocata]